METVSLVLYLLHLDGRDTPYYHSQKRENPGEDILYQRIEIWGRALYIKVSKIE